MKLKADHGYFLIEGSTSDVTHLLNFLAPGNLLLRTREYRPLSFITIISWLPPRVSHFATPLSSISTCFFNASDVFEYPKTSATSLPTNQPSPLISTALTSSSNSYQSYKFFANKKMRLCMKKRSF